jgi:hypothetical protein
MPLSIFHTFVSPIPDTDDPNLIKTQSHWNAAHSLVGTLDPSQFTYVPMRLPTASPTVAILSTDVEVGIDPTAGAVTATLPKASTWAANNANGVELVLLDRAGTASATNTITPSLFAGDTMLGGFEPTVSSPAGFIKLRPFGNPVTGWYVRQ